MEANSDFPLVAFGVGVSTGIAAGIAYLPSGIMTTMYFAPTLP